jgi:hypothetical protein
LAASEFVVVWLIRPWIHAAEYLGLVESHAGAVCPSNPSMSTEDEAD